MSPPSSPTDAGARWHEIEDLLDEIEQAAKSAASPGELYRLVVNQIVPAVGASSGAVWSLGRPGELRLEYASDSDASGEIRDHGALIDEVSRGVEPRIFPPGGDRRSSGDQGLANPTDCWLICHPFQIGPQSRGVIELIQRRDSTSVDARGHVQVLRVLVELIEEFHRARELRELRDRDAIRQQYDSFAEHVHRSLDVRQTAFAIANDGRRIIECDRLSVLVLSGRRCRAMAISGVDQIDRRAKLVRRLEALASACAASGDPVWHGEGATDVPEPIETLLSAYLDEGHARSLAIVPLHEPENRTDGRPARTIAVLVAEQFGGVANEDQMRQRVAVLAAHSAVALNNALVHSRLPLAWLGRTLARVRWLVERRQLPKTAVAALIVATVAAALALVPADFDIEVRGELQPKLRRDVFASDDGVVNDLLVSHGQSARANQPLVLLRKPALDLEMRRVSGEIQTAEKKLASVTAQRLENLPQTPESRRNARDLAADEEELKETLKGLRQQQANLDAQQRDLIVRSPIDGQALTWNLKQLLEARPVQRGQTLLTVGDLNGPWVLELHVPDYRTGHILKARDRIQKDLGVSFVLASEPAVAYEGRVADAALTTEVDEASTPTLLVTVDFDRTNVEGLRPGATAIARVHCGRRPVGYVWLHDLFEFVQSHWWW
jgi:hypothetical protein